MVQEIVAYELWESCWKEIQDFKSLIEDARKDVKLDELGFILTVSTSMNS